jgi:hypothetical protein
MMVLLELGRQAFPRRFDEADMAHPDCADKLDNIK